MSDLGETGSIVDLGTPVVGGAFDEHHPPDAALVGDCVHCGFCLPTCPTYVLWGEEMDSPRGRIYLMKEGLEGEPMTDSMVSHFDACLGCMACVTACPSGVQYDTLIEQTRAQVERNYDRSKKDRALRGQALPHQRSEVLVEHGSADMNRAEQPRSTHKPCRSTPQFWPRTQCVSDSWSTRRASLQETGQRVLCMSLLRHSTDSPRECSCALTVGVAAAKSSVIAARAVIRLIMKNSPGRKQVAPAALRAMRRSESSIMTRRCASRMASCTSLCTRDRIMRFAG